MTRIRPYIWLAIGSALLLFMGWRWNAPVAIWLAPIFLIRFFRSQERWPATLIALPAMTLSLFLNVHGGWDFSIIAEIGIGLVRALPILIALYADRFAARRLPTAAAMLAYPAAYVAADYLLALTPLGTVFSAAATQYPALQFIQVASLAGIWGLSFIMGWFASLINLIWEHDFDLRAEALPAAIFGVLLSALLVVGGWRLSHPPTAPTVRVACVTVEQASDYYGAVIDVNTPAEVAHRFGDELEELENDLYAASQRAVESGAQIIFWSEGNGVVYPEDLDGFLDRAATFARENDVYFAPAYVVFRYDETSADNVVTMVTPDGEVAFTYEKTKSWYPSNSDGVLHAIDTPYGRLSAAICFDMDFPNFIRQAGKQGVDIMLVPAYDWEPIKPFHTQVGLFRAVENGMSIIRQVNAGTSMAVDHQGQLLAYQDYYHTSDPVMLADMPTKGTRTLYAIWDDWLVYVSGAFVLIVLQVGGLRRRQEVDA